MCVIKQVVQPGFYIYRWKIVKKITHKQLLRSPQKPDFQRFDTASSLTGMTVDIMACKKSHSRRLAFSK